MSGFRETTPSDTPRPTRREALRVGGLTCLGLSLPGLLRSTLQAQPSKATRFGRARSCLVIFLTGGPSQLETFDPKPEAPSDTRGPFGTVPTTIPGVHFGEL